MTGETFGDLNPLLKTKAVKVPPPPSASGSSRLRTTRILGTKEKDYVVSAPAQRQNTFGNVTVSASVSPTIPREEEETKRQETQNIASQYKQYMYKLNQMKLHEHGDSLKKRGLEVMSFDEFKKQKEEEKYASLSEEQKRKMDKEAEETNAKRMAGMRLISDIHAWQRQGAKIDETASMVRLSTKNIPIIQLGTDELEQDMYMFWPMWSHTLGAAKLSDEELQKRTTNGDFDDESLDSIVEEDEAERKMREEEEREKERERQILDYSAKVNNGFIEVKIGEDMEAMSAAYNQHMRKRSQMGLQYNEEQLDKMGLKFYTWEEWQKYYRKMKGLPEDGIKRIPF